ncbi:hypothetical protein GQ44DRAFT_779856 [Phaeosphaeriaceae sp. PMI808]|nr:hypothetical protein GQ44DRAFT_779856 [Phaeosphaeriaceae sp. PMI808]
MCRQMNKLESLTQLAGNQTRLDAMVAKGKINQTVVDAIKAQAAEATTKLQALQPNTTLMQDCAVFNAYRKDVFACKRVAKFKKLAALANNQTAMDAFVAKK